MRRARISVCTRMGCGAEIIFAVTEARRFQPLNAKPDPAGRVAVYRDATDTWHARTLRDGENPAGIEKLYMPHAATCAAAKIPKELPPNVVRFDQAAPAARARMIQRRQQRGRR